MNGIKTRMLYGSGFNSANDNRIERCPLHGCLFLFGAGTVKIFRQTGKELKIQGAKWCNMRLSDFSIRNLGN